ncbi:NlpC/P60 family protein [Corynebacterium sp.]|uniref:NlpC/P60 family protein n=1 Tax=Corynebacterium sp. TaxID=1720 RepID=UPI0027B966F8|nr:NlpC/P60 family protein [Corynebacterium sp.]
MSSIAFRSRQRILAFATASAVVLGGAAFIPAFASADDVDVVKEQVQETGFELSRKHEELKNLEAELEERAHRVENLGALTEEAGAKAAQAAEARVKLQQTVDQIAKAQYTGTALDKTTSVIASGSPQEMIDRQSFMGVLSRDAEQEVERLQREVKDSARGASKANAALQEAIFHKTDLELQRAKLQAERDALESKIAELEARVDSLSEEERNALAGGNPVDLAAAGEALASIAGSGASGAALTRVGMPYSWGAAGPSSFDCSGLMHWAFQQQGKNIPRTSQAQLAGGTRVSLNALEPGDIIGYYPGTTHVGMYIGDGKVVHASTYGVPVQVVPFDSMPITGAARY